MRTKSLRIPEELELAVRVVEREERVEEATAMRKVLRLGLEAYLARLYAAGRITLREAARNLRLSLPETLDVFLACGVKGNLTAAEICQSLEKCR